MGYAFHGRPGLYVLSLHKPQVFAANTIDVAT